MTETKILIVEDEAISALILKEHLEKAGYSVLTATNGQQAWDILTGSGETISLVIADRMMPGMDGVELTKHIRANPIFSKLLVVMLTGAADKEEQIEAVKEGVYDFLLKPIEPHLLLKVTERALRAGQASP